MTTLQRKTRFIGPWRRGFQAASAIAFLLLPYLSIGGHGALRIDIPGLTLYLAGRQFRIEEMYIAWIFVLWLIFLFLFLTLVLGRVWCGWACPQTLLSDAADFIDRILGAKRPGAAGAAARHAGYLAIASLCAASTICYFIEPGRFWSGLVRGGLGPWPLGGAIFLTAAAYADIVWVRRLFCRAFCPYGRFQTVLTDAGTLTLRAVPAELGRCIDCKACLRSCPTGIDIREGFQIECINCARCLDACRRVMAKRGESGIIEYQFGQEGKGPRAAFNPKRAAVFLLVTALFAAFVYTATHRKTAAIDIGRSPLPAREARGNTIVFFRATLTNFTGHALRLRLSVTEADGTALDIKGPSTFSLPPRGREAVTFAVSAPASSAAAGPRPVFFTISTERGKVLQTIKGYL